MHEQTDLGERTIATGRRRRKGRWVLAVAASTALLSTLAISPASAERPGAERLDVTDTFEYSEPALAGACGIDEVLVSGEFSSKGWLFDDGSARVQDRVSVVVSNPANGAEVLISGVRNFDDAPVVETSEGGFTTLVFESVVTGSPEKWLAPGVGVIAHDRGRVTIVTTLVFDDSVNPEEADPLVFFGQEVIGSRGSHSIAENGFIPTEEQLEGICGVLAG